jgi:hypothetical protein
LPHASETSQTLRTSLANAGLPDGFDLSLASLYTPGAEAVAAQLATVGIGTRVTQIVPEEAADLTPFHLILFGSSGQDLVQNIDVENRIDLFTVPISYRAIPELAIEFTPSGFPIARR